ncbi:MAG TPA: hypothetical protein ENI65_07675 [Gammaproteobacteria bacterium]|nr:hypothetical protein [Gammaproteobacteria bacterium]
MMLSSVHVKIIVFLLAGFVSGYAGNIYAIDQKTGIDEQAQLPFWEVSTGGMSLRLIQRLPIQSRGYFLARGFNATQAERIARSCIFQTVFKNTSQGGQPGKASTLEYNLNDWRVIYKGKKRKMKTRQDWASEWRAEKVSKPAQIAFEWSLYPTSQQYKPGDYNWGMSVFNLEPGSRFDLEITWMQYGRKNTAIIKNMECAPDINPQPTEAL